MRSTPSRAFATRSRTCNQAQDEGSHHRYNLPPAFPVLRRARVLPGGREGEVLSTRIARQTSVFRTPARGCAYRPHTPSGNDWETASNGRQLTVYGTLAARW